MAEPAIFEPPFTGYLKQSNVNFGDYVLNGKILVGS